MYFEYIFQIACISITTTDFNNTQAHRVCKPAEFRGIPLVKAIIYEAPLLHYASGINQ